MDVFLAKANLTLIREYQSGGLVAMTGDGTNDAPALAQSDVAVAMTLAAKDAGNMVDRRREVLRDHPRESSRR